MTCTASIRAAARAVPRPETLRLADIAMQAAHHRLARCVAGASPAEVCDATAQHRAAREALMAERAPYAAAVTAAVLPLAQAAAERAASAAATLGEALADIDAACAELERAHGAIAPERRPPALPHAALAGLPAAWGANPSTSAPGDAAAAPGA